MLRARLRKANLAEQSHRRQRSQSPNESRVQYDVGYGDFCFGRLTDRVVIGQTRHVFVDKVTAVEDIKVAWAQTRAEPFPFFKLPLEVRRLVYRKIFGPLYLDDMETLYFRISPTRENPNLWRYRGNYKWYLMQQRRRQHLSTPDDTVPFFSAVDEEPQPKNPNAVMTLQEYQAEKQRLTDKNETHPTRSAAYRLEVHSPCTEFALVKAKSSDLYIEWIRQLSNVCTKMRKEIGDTIWMKSYMASDDREGMWLLQSMLMERPAIYKSIKSLDLKVAVDKPQTYLNYLLDFGPWCKYISEHLELDSLTLTIDISEDFLTPNNITTGELSRLKACSDILVKQSFEVYMFITKWGLGAAGLNEKRLAERLAVRRREFLPLFKKLMTPKSLLPPPITEEPFASSDGDGKVQGNTSEDFVSL